MNISFNKSTLNNFSVAAFLLVVLFFPRSDIYFRYYFAVVLITAILLLGNLREFYFDWLTFTGIAVLLISILSIYLRFGFIISPNLRDYTEFGRLLLPVILLMFRGKFKDVSIKTIFAVFAAYTSIDCFISLLDFSNLDFLGVVSFTNSVYVSEFHANIKYRIDGLSAGPGQHGVTMLVMFIFFYVRAFQTAKVIYPLIFAITAIFPIFLSQSRTSIIVLALICLLVPVLYLFEGSKKVKRRAVPILLLLVGGGVYLFTQFISYFDRIQDLALSTTEISSYQERLGRYEGFIDRALDYPLFLLFGYGKEYFNQIAFDNEYLLMFLVHGPIITFIIIGGAITFLILTLLKKRKDILQHRIMLFFLLLSGLIVAYPSTFFFLPVLLPINLLFINLTFWEDKRLTFNKLA